jgi:hypothetical protein
VSGVLAAGQTPTPERRLVIVGEANPYGADPYFALYHLPRNASGNRLREIVGLTDHRYEKLPKVNLCPSRWSMKVARERAVALLGAHDTLILLGAKVRSAFDGPAPFAVGSPSEGKLLVGLPHPSGLNRAWDEPGARDRARSLLREHVPQVPWGEG